MIKNLKHVLKIFSIRQLCEHDYRPYCITESDEEIERELGSYITRTLKGDVAVSRTVDYEKGYSLIGWNRISICTKCGKKIRTLSSMNEIGNEIERIKKLGLETNKPNL